MNAWLSAKVQVLLHLGVEEPELCSSCFPEKGAMRESPGGNVEVRCFPATVLDAIGNRVGFFHAERRPPTGQRHHDRGASGGYIERVTLPL